MTEIKKYSGPVTPAELDEVFGFVLLDPKAILVDRIRPPDKVGSIFVPDHVQAQRQTGATQGTIIQLGSDAKSYLDEMLKKVGKTYGATPGDRVSFPVYAPQPAGLMQDGFNILPGMDESRYACIEIIEMRDVRGLTPASKLKERS